MCTDMDPTYKESMLVISAWLLQHLAFLEFKKNIKTFAENGLKVYQKCMKPTKKIYT